MFFLPDEMIHLSDYSTTVMSVYLLSVYFGQRPLGNHGNLPNCNGSLQKAKMIFYKPRCNSLQAFEERADLQNRLSLEMSLIPQGEKKFCLNIVWNIQGVNKFSFPISRFSLLSNLCLIPITFQTGDPKRRPAARSPPNWFHFLLRTKQAAT